MYGVVELCGDMLISIVCCDDVEFCFVNLILLDSVVVYYWYDGEYEEE